MEVSDEAIEFVLEDPPHHDPCAVVNTYFNSWWESSVCPADSDTTIMTRENLHLCMERHQLARMEYAIPYISNDDDTPGKSSFSTMPLPRILEDHIRLRPKPSKSNCKSCHQNFVLAMECVDKLSQVCESAKELQKGFRVPHSP